MQFCAISLHSVNATMLKKIGEKHATEIVSCTGRHDRPNVSVLQLPVRLALKERLLKSSQFQELHSLHKTLTFLVRHLFDNN